MPDVGELKKGKEIGTSSLYNKYIWLRCPKCGYERWVFKKKYNTEGWCQRCSRTRYTKENHHNWKGGRYIQQRGYIVMQLEPDNPYYPMAYKGYVFEHRYIMAQHIRRCLTPEEQVHHRNGIKTDNGIENLELIMNCTHNGWVRCPHCEKGFLVK